MFALVLLSLSIAPASAAVPCEIALPIAKELATALDRLADDPGESVAVKGGLKGGGKVGSGAVNGEARGAGGGSLVFKRGEDGSVRVGGAVNGEVGLGPNAGLLLSGGAEVEGAVGGELVFDSSVDAAAWALDRAPGVDLEGAYVGPELAPKGSLGFGLYGEADALIGGVEGEAGVTGDLSGTIARDAEVTATIPSPIGDVEIVWSGESAPNTDGGRDRARSLEIALPDGAWEGTLRAREEAAIAIFVQIEAALPGAAGELMTGEVFDAVVDAISAPGADVESIEIVWRSTESADGEVAQHPWRLYTRAGLEFSPEIDVKALDAKAKIALERKTLRVEGR